MAEKRLRQALVDYFNEDMKRREERLEGVRQRIADIQSHLEKRAAAKADIIELQLRAFAYEADGLGLVNTPPARLHQPRRLAWRIPEAISPC